MRRAERCSLLRQEIEALDHRVTQMSTDLDWLRRRLLEKRQKLADLTEDDKVLK